MIIDMAGLLSPSDWISSVYPSKSPNSYTHDEVINVSHLTLGFVLHPHVEIDILLIKLLTLFS